MRCQNEYLPQFNLCVFQIWTQQTTKCIFSDYMRGISVDTNIHNMMHIHYIYIYITFNLSFCNGYIYHLFSSPVYYVAILKFVERIYIIIAKNIRYLLWNRGAWRFFNDTYLTIEVQGIRCTNHLHDSCPLTGVNPHFTAPGCRYYFKINS